MSFISYLMSYLPVVPLLSPSLASLISLSHLSYLSLSLSVISHYCLSIFFPICVCYNLLLFLYIQAERFMKFQKELEEIAQLISMLPFDINTTEAINITVTMPTIVNSTQSSDPDHEHVSRVPGQRIIQKRRLEVHILKMSSSLHHGHIY